MTTRTLSLFVLLAGCGLTPQQKDGANGTDSGDSGTTGDDGNGATIFDIRSGKYGDGESVTLTGVLVSSPLTRADKTTGKSDGFFIQDPKGGANSGMYVWKQAGIGPDELSLSVGDEIKVSGRITEYYDWTEFVVTDLSSIEKTGTGTLPAPVDLGDGAGVDWNVYESVPVTLQSQTVDSIDEFQTGELSGGIWLDDGFVFNDYDCRGNFASVTGIIFYTYERYSINNRDAADLGAYTDGDALPATVHDLQTGAVCGPVTVTGAIVTSPAFGETDSTFFIEQADGVDADGSYSGIAVFLHGELVEPEPGDIVTITGSVGEYYDLTELNIDSADDIVTGETGDIVTYPVDAAPADWELYEGCRIELSDVTFTADSDKYGQAMTNYGIFLDDEFVDFTVKSGDNWAHAAGVLYYTSYDDVPEWKLEPVTMADVPQ